LLFIGRTESELDPLDPVTIEHIDANKNILFAGQQSDVRPYYVASDAFVFPTRFKEGVPNVVLEAGAMGLPCIVTDVNGCNEIIINNQNGVIIPPNDETALFNTMKQFVEDHDLVNELSNNARGLIDSRYEQKRFWNALVQFYNNISDQQGKE
jgi:glycosyltransferase involved in cell wall biosynthesis